MSATHLDAADFGRLATAPHVVGQACDLRGRSITGPVDLKNAQIANLDLTGATFCGPVRFSGVTFLGLAWFRGCEFAREVELEDCVAENDARFDEARFAGPLRMRRVEVRGVGSFDRAIFQEAVRLDEVTVLGNLSLAGSTFQRDVSLRNLECLGGLWIDHARFASAVDLGGIEVHGRTWINASDPGPVGPVSHGYRYGTVRAPVGRRGAIC